MILLTVAVTVWTSNLVLGVLAGIIAAILLFARRVAHMVRAHRRLNEDGSIAYYEVRGPLFFASSNDLFEHFDYAHDPHKVIIDLIHVQN